ncbi:AraC-like ligand-binding domain-containing protein [Rhodococcus opacus]|uniref:AraC-like ligand-binding domain-containing protein n=1 Tax=Rhodococcus opacus TaxID=37919 RepID=UPI001C490168|nr:helix-turn-helix domain-containing protein [Rhodococcus opacus]MBV6762123.1 helix-turn-helix domain-containing protein [Rhodococcus opacus]
MIREDATAPTAKTTISTDSVAHADRREFWTRAISRTYVDLQCDVPEPSGSLGGSIEVADLATLGLSKVTSTAQSVLRTPAGIARACEDYFLVSVQNRGSGFVVQDDRIARFDPGDFVLYDTTRPYELHFTDDFEQYVLRLPGATLRTLVRNTDDLTARTVPGAQGAGKLLLTMVRTLLDDATMSPQSAEAVAQSVEYILVAGLAGLSGLDAPPPELAARRLAAIKQEIRARLRDPDLSIASVAAALHLSPSTLHRAFASEPLSASEWIWTQRLEGAKRELVDPTLSNSSISDVAFAWGFSDPAHFSRAFRARFGCSPREYRTAAIE